MKMTIEGAIQLPLLRLRLFASLITQGNGKEIVKLRERRGRAPAGVAGLISPLPLSLSFIILPI